MRKGLYQKFVSGCRGGCQPPARYESKCKKRFGEFAYIAILPNLFANTPI